MNARRMVISGVGVNGIGQAANLLIQVASLPVYLAAWGVSGYGEWLILSAFATFLSMSDVGFATAAANEMTMLAAGGNRKTANAVYQSTWGLLCCVGGIAVAAFIGVFCLTPVITLLPLTETSDSDAAAILTLQAAYVFFYQQSSVIQAGFRCDGNYALGFLLGVVGRLLEFAGRMLAVTISGSMVATALTPLVIRVALLYVFWAVLRRRTPWLRLGLSNANLSIVKRLWRPALGFVLMPLSYATINQGFLQVIGSTLSPASAAVFAAHRTISNLTTQFADAVARGITPTLSTLIGGGNRQSVLRLHRLAFQWTIWLCALACGASYVFFPSILDAWTKGRISPNYGLMAILLFTALLRSAWLTSSAVAQSSNRHTRMAVRFLLLSIVATAAGGLLLESQNLLAAVSCLMALEAAMTATVVPESLRAVGDKAGDFARAMLLPPALRSVLPRQQRKMDQNQKQPPGEKAG